MHNRTGTLHRLQVIRSLAMVLLAVLFSSCASRGTSEFLIYRDAFSATNTAAQAILDRLAVSERALFMVTMSGESLADIEFEPGNARYYVETIDPPITSSLRSSIYIVNAYGETMAALASGESAEAIGVRVSEIGTVATNAIVSVAGLAGPGSLAPSTVLAESVVDPLKAFEPLVVFAYTQRTRQEFQDRLLEDYESIDAVLVKMHDISPKIFDIMKTGLRQKSVTAGGDRPDPDVFQDIKELRVLMSNWIILIDRSRVALAQTRAAIESGSTGSSLAGFIVTARELDAAASGVRSNLAKLGQ